MHPLTNPRLKRPGYNTHFSAITTDQKTDRVTRTPEIPTH